MLTKSREHSRDFFVYVCSLCYSVISWACQRSFTCDRPPLVFSAEKTSEGFRVFYKCLRRNACGGRKMLIRRSLDVFFQKTRDDFNVFVTPAAEPESRRIRNQY